MRRIWVPWMVTCMGAALTAALPFWYFHAATGTWLPRILPQLSSDSLYYLKQIREVLDGHPLLGNPFIREYADARFPGLVLAIWIGAIPGFLGGFFGLSINGIFAVNVVLYHLLAGTCFFLLFLRLTNGQRWLAAGMAIIGVLSLHNLLIRPVLQIVYVALAAFLLCLCAVLQKPHDKRWHTLLGLAAVFAFYLYPHLWMPEFAALALLTARTIWIRDWRALRLLTALWVGIIVLCIPQIRTILSLFHDPSAAELNLRSGLVETHRVLPLTITNLKYMILLALCLLFLRTRRRLSPPEMTLLLIAAGILAAGFSNVITGKEMDLDTHPLWMAFFINIAALTVFVAEIRRGIQGTQRKITAENALIAVLLCAFFFTTTARLVRNAFPYPVTGITEPVPIQDYARVFSFLEQDEPGEHVVLAPNLLGSYVPLATDDYLLYSRYAVLHVIPTSELLERFLIQRVDDIDEAFVRENLGSFLGWRIGRVLDYANAYGGNAQPLDFVGGEQFIRETMAKHADIAAHYDAYLAKYHVRYILTDVRAEDNPRIPASAVIAHRDDRFTIYRFGPTDAPAGRAGAGSPASP